MCARDLQHRSAPLPIAAVATRAASGARGGRILGRALARLLLLRVREAEARLALRVAERGRAPRLEPDLPQPQVLVGREDLAELGRGRVRRRLEPLAPLVGRLARVELGHGLVPERGAVLAQRVVLLVS